MKHLKIAYSFDVQYYFVDSDREIVPVEQTDFTDVAVAVLSDQDFAYIDKIDATGFGIPIMIIMPGGERLPEKYIGKVDAVITEEMVNKSRCISTAERLASNYEQFVLPPFFADLVEYVSEKTILSTALAIRTANFSRSIRQDAISMISTVPIFSNPIYATPTLRWAIC